MTGRGISIGREKTEEGVSMKRIENECVGCKSMGLPCIGYGCPNRRVTRYYCDKCGEEADLYYFDGEELCIDCIEERLEKVE